MTHYHTLIPASEKGLYLALFERHTSFSPPLKRSKARTRSHDYTKMEGMMGKVVIFFFLGALEPSKKLCNFGWEKWILGTTNSFWHSSPVSRLFKMCYTMPHVSSFALAFLGNQFFYRDINIYYPYNSLVSPIQQAFSEHLPHDKLYHRS